MHIPTDDRPPLSGLVASEIRAEMGRQGLTNRTLAAQLGVSEQWVGRRISPAPGRQPLTLDDLVKVAAVISVPYALLIERALQAVKS